MLYGPRMRLTDLHDDDVRVAKTCAENGHK